MKKLTEKQRLLDSQRNIKRRKEDLKQKHINLCIKKTRWKEYNFRVAANINNPLEWRETNKWLNNFKNKGLNIRITKKRRVIIYLPESLNFNDDYELTALNMTAIRKLANVDHTIKGAYKLASVNFDGLKNISTSAALVLTAELSKWDDVVRKRLLPDTRNWDKKILKQLTELGFFDLFQKSLRAINNNKQTISSDLNLVRYIKGRCGDGGKPRQLKEELTSVVGETINKWTFLHSGLTEAITNVTHHAYPNLSGYNEQEKNWYLTGSYNKKTKELKIIFYDQGIGIPKSLPASRLWERTLDAISSLPIAERKKDEVLLKAAMQLDRTRTDEEDRGKGLQDMLEFIKQRKDGFLSILSLKGLYKYSLQNGSEYIKSVGFNEPIRGTLIIWSATLDI